jgi:two-component system response regulator FixJ
LAEPAATIVHIIEDDADVRDSLAVLFQIHGLDVSEHADAQAFLDALPRLPPGCIVTDLQMPEMSGLEMLARLRSQALDWPAILVSGRAGGGVAREADELGAAFLEKPFTPDALVKTVRRLAGAASPA